MCNKNVAKTQQRENLPLINFWIGITSRAVHITLLTQAFHSTEARECILVEIIETPLLEVEQVTRNGRITVDLALQY